MPNWAEGILKIRGARKDVKKFLTEAMNPLPEPGSELKAILTGEQTEPPKAEIQEDEFDFVMRAPNGFHIKNTRRAFVEGVIEYYFEDQAEDVVTIDTFKQAWGVDAEPFIKHSKQYDLDIRIYVFERGMEFNQEIEIHKGELIKNNEIQFDDYEWECLMPNLGG